MNQTTDTLLMIAPVRFGYNPQAAESNSFMESDAELGSEERQHVQAEARAEFDQFADMLRSAGIDVLVYEDMPEPHTPDSIFPNNWISFHDDGRLVLYPMEPSNRRLERRTDVMHELMERFHFQRLDISAQENEGVFLEGTGSLVLDHTNKIAYANISSRMHQAALQDWAVQMDYTPLAFTARRVGGGGIYHTNVLMAIGEQTAVLCAESIVDMGERQKVCDSLRSSGKTTVEISQHQMDEFAGNMLLVRNKQGSRFWAMSSRAFNALTPEQRATLRLDGELLHAPLDVIERYGGGSARCMMAEVFVPLHISAQKKSS
jgi:hypothetical protein